MWFKVMERNTQHLTVQSVIGARDLIWFAIVSLILPVAPDSAVRSCAGHVTSCPLVLQYAGTSGHKQQRCREAGEEGEEVVTAADPGQIPSHLQTTQGA